METKQIVIMTKSAKNNNFCIAGFEFPGKKWVRLVSDVPEIEEAVPSQDTVLADGTNMQIFDAIEVKTSDKISRNLIQPENFYYDATVKWKKIGQSSLEKVLRWRGFDRPNKLFYNDDRLVDAEFIKTQTNRESLLFVPIKNVVVEVKQNNGSPRFFVHFIYNGAKYFHLGLSDIKLRRDFYVNDDGKYLFAKDAAAVFSLTNSFKDTGKCFKMLAQIFPKS